ncbi:MAG: hypothetical protein HY805_01765 [Nitrospirae bacterium]|nr:hypothetical protein [Nitrospirota bacterium]
MITNKSKKTPTACRPVALLLYCSFIVLHEIIIKSIMFPDHPSIRFIKDIDATDVQKANAGAEIAYLLLHISDRQAFEVLGPIGRDKVIDEVAPMVISRYCKTVLRKDTPLNLMQDLGCHMLTTFNERTILYHKCKSVIDKENPWVKGTMVFALSFYIHKALGQTDRDDVEDILCGKRNLEESDMRDFPIFTQTLEIVIYFGNVCANNRFVFYELNDFIRSFPQRLAR